MDLEDLRKVAAVAGHPRLTDAAAALGVSQPTLSRVVGRVERQLGAEVFRRDPHGMRVTPLGGLVVEAARELTERHDRLLRDLAGVLDPEAGTVRLAFLDSMATSLVPRVLHDFRAAAPRVRIVLTQEPGHEMLADLANGTVELAISSPRPGAPHGWIPMQEQQLVVVVPHGHAFARRARVRLLEVAEEDFVTVPPGFGFRRLVDELFASAGRMPQIAFESQDLATIAGLVGAGLGVAVLPEHLAVTSRTVGVPLDDVSARRTVGLTWRTDRPLAPPAARLRDFIGDRAPYA
jgi:DNA-binding transcriptional LysR family regulator